MAEQTQTPEAPRTPFGRKYRMTMVGVGAVLAIGILAAALEKFVGIDITELAKWAMVAVASTIGLGAGSIAYEDANRP